MGYGEKQLEGGHAASHAKLEPFPIFASPATGTEKNVIREDLVTVACWKVNDLRFDFGSSFVMPETKPEFTELKELIAKNSKAPLSVFGHADPTGNDENNKALSGRRAEAIYAVLIRDTERWEKIYKADGWSLKHTQIMLQALGRDPGNTSGSASAQSTQTIKDFQSANGLSPDGSAGPDTRAKLFEQYMKFLWPDKLEKSAFLGGGANAGGKGDYQGCSEFNPVMVFSKTENTELNKPANQSQRNEENSVNRRVMVLLFRPGTTAPEDKWPCPKASEGGAGCQKRFWSDGDARRSPQEERRAFVDTEDTFACRFYHRLVVNSPCEKLGPITPSGALQVSWKPEKARCGQEAELIVETALTSITEVEVTFTALQVASNKAPDPVKITLTDGKGSWKWKVVDIAFEKDSSFLESEEIKAEAIGGGKVGTGNLKVVALLNGAKSTFDENRSWSGFTNHSKFEQRIEKFRSKVDVKFDILKCWGAYYVNLTPHGVTGKAGGCPWDKYRWARSTGANPMRPDQYYDGSNWVAMPATFNYSGTSYGAYSFYKSGTKFLGVKGGEWPESFTEYDFNSAKYTKRRQDWCDITRKKWTDVFYIKRKNCKSAKGTRCCRYDLSVKMEFKTVNAPGEGVIAVCPGSLRSNASNWFMDDSRLEMAAHEAGHHMDNPDEYTGGAVDTTLNGDGAVNGIDSDCIMGQNMTKVKKRHYHAFVEMVKRIIKAKYGAEYDYETEKRT